MGAGIGLGYGGYDSRTNTFTDEHGRRYLLMFVHACPRCDYTNATSEAGRILFCPGCKCDLEPAASSYPQYFEGGTKVQEELF